jgi:DNA-binding XRE family transcriptional regulator
MKTTSTNKLRERRTAQGLLQVELAAVAGVCLATLNKLECWGFRPSPATAATLAKVLKCKPQDIFPE